MIKLNQKHSSTNVSMRPSCVFWCLLVCFDLCSDAALVITGAVASSRGHRSWGAAIRHLQGEGDTTPFAEGERDWRREPWGTKVGVVRREKSWRMEGVKDWEERWNKGNTEKGKKEGREEMKKERWRGRGVCQGQVFEKAKRKDRDWKCLSVHCYSLFSRLYHISTWWILAVQLFPCHWS